MHGRLFMQGRSNGKTLSAVQCTLDEVKGNHQRRRVHEVNATVLISALRVAVTKMNGIDPGDMPCLVHAN